MSDPTLREDLCADCGHHIHRPQSCVWLNCSCRWSSAIDAPVRAASPSLDREGRYLTREQFDALSTYIVAFPWPEDSGMEADRQACIAILDDAQPPVADLDELGGDRVVEDGNYLTPESLADLLNREVERMDRIAFEHPSLKQRKVAAATYARLTAIPALDTEKVAVRCGNCGADLGYPYNSTSTGHVCPAIPVLDTEKPEGIDRLHNKCDYREARKSDHQTDLNAECNSLARWIVDDVIAALRADQPPSKGDSE